MKGKRKRSFSGFKRGHTPYLLSNNTSYKEPITHDILPFQRLTPSEMKQVQNKPLTASSTMGGPNKEGNSSPSRMLRPKKEPLLKVEENAEIPSQPR